MKGTSFNPGQSIPGKVRMYLSKIKIDLHTIICI